MGIIQLNQQELKSIRESVLSKEVINKIKRELEEHIFKELRKELKEEIKIISMNNIYYEKITKNYNLLNKRVNIIEEKVKSIEKFVAEEEE